MRAERYDAGELTLSREQQPIHDPAPGGAEGGDEGGEQADQDRRDRQESPRLLAEQILHDQRQ